MRPSSYAGPHHTIGLPVLSPSSRLNQTLPTSSANSTLERPASIRKAEQSKKSDLSTKLVSFQNHFLVFCLKVYENLVWKSHVENGTLFWQNCTNPHF